MHQAEAVRGFTHAAGQGSPAGQIQLGMMYEKGDGGVEHNDVEARRWYTRASASARAMIRQPGRRKGPGDIVAGCARALPSAQAGLKRQHLPLPEGRSSHLFRARRGMWWQRPAYRDSLPS